MAAVVRVSPLYSYRCPDGHERTILVPLTQLPPKEVRCRSCPKRCKRVFAPPAKHLWGKGGKP